jgi:hypothetical protein
MISTIKKQVKYPKISGFVSQNTNITEGLEVFLKEHPADILVMHPQKHSLLESLFSKSVTKKMSFQTRVPMLVVKSSTKVLS